MNEVLKLKVSPKGQITLPKKVRSKLSIKDYVYLELKEDKAELKPMSLIDELEDLIVKDLKSEGYSAEQISKMLPQKKKELAQALSEELKEHGREDTISHKDALKELGLD